MGTVGYLLRDGGWKGWQSGQGVKLTIHLHLVSRLRMRGAVFSLALILLWYVQEQLDRLYVSCVEYRS